MPPSVASAWTRIGASVLLIATALGSGFVAASPAQAAPAPASVTCGSVSDDTTFNAAVAQVNNGACNEINFTTSFRLLTPKNINADRVPSLTLTGNRDDSTLTSNPNLGIQIVTSDDTPLDLTMSNLTFSGFDGRSGGTAVALTVQSLRSSLTAELTNVSFIDNFGGATPGAAYLEAYRNTADVTINGYSEFRGNRSNTFAGGAIAISAWSGSTVTIGSPGDDSVSFVSNTSLTQYGGAIAVLAVPGSTFPGVNHQLATYGGTFADDSAAAAGGAIYTVGSAALNNTDFTNNTASGDVAGAVHAGGLVVVNGGTFHGNRAGGAGGAVSAGDDTATSQITNATFTNNSAGGHGGAVRALGLLTVTGSTFRDDSAGLSGGAIAADDTITITSSLFQDDTAAQAGGAIISVSASVLSQGSTYRANSAGNDGGAISAPRRVTSTDDTFIGNRTSLYDGGAIEASRVTTTDSRFTSNRAQANGGAIAAASLDDSGSDFVGNRSLGFGGGVYLDDTQTASAFTVSTFRDDSAGLSGGAIYSGGPLTITRSLFEDDTAGVSGGAIHAGKTLSVSLSEFRSNTSLDAGGAVNSVGTTTVVNSTFENNEARGLAPSTDGSGGAITAVNSLSVMTSEFTGNTSAGNGGAIAASGPLTLQDDSFTNNESLGGDGGGAVFAIGSSAMVTRVAFDGNNSADEGGAMMAWNGASIVDSSFELNDAGANGGAVSARGNLSVTSSEFTHNNAAVEGGAVVVFLAPAQILDSRFHGNLAGGSGGALFADDTATISRTTFTDDTAGQNGGAVSAEDLIMHSSTFIGNQAVLYNGGAVKVSRSADIWNSTFFDNSASFGGALDFDNLYVPSRISFSTFVSNTASVQGSAINARSTTPIALVGSVLAGASPLCWAEYASASLDLASVSSYSFATDTSCGGGDDSTSIKTLYTTDDSLGVASAITNDDTPGWQVVIPDDTSVINAYVPLSVLPSITTDQLNGLRNSPNSLTSAGAVQVRPTSMTGPANVTVAPGTNATFSVTGYPGIGPTITYQWQSSTDGTSWSNITGNASAQTATLVIPSVPQSDLGLRVRVLAADAYGNNGTSATATLTVSSPSPGPGPNPTPTPTPTPAPSPSPAPIPSPIPPGGALLQVDGRVVPVDVQPRPGDAGLRVQGQGWDMTLDGLDRNGQPLGLNPQGALITDTGSGVSMGGSGFAPGSQIGFFLDPPIAQSRSSAYSTASTTTDLGEIAISADGRHGAVVELPETVAPGSHVLQAVGIGTSGERRVLSLGIVVNAWIDLTRGQRTPSGRFDVVRATGTTGGLPAGAVLTPWVRSPGQDTFRRGSASITVRADGTFEWTRKVQKSKGLAAYVSYAETDSDRVYWARLR